MNKLVRIAVVAPGSCWVDRAIEAGFEAIEQLEYMLDPMRASSAVSMISNTAVGDMVPVPAHIWEMLRIANDIAYRTDGIFDVVAAGSGGTAEWTDMDLSMRGAVRVRKKINVSLGGLAAGFAADLAAQALKEMGVSAGLVDIGGCIRAFGQRAWRIEYGASYDPDTDTTRPGVPVIVHDGAIAGIGSMFEWVKLIDTENKQVSSTQEWADISVLVRAPNCAIADALTKVAALNMDEREQLLDQFGAQPIILSSNCADQVRHCS